MKEAVADKLRLANLERAAVAIQRAVRGHGARRRYYALKEEEKRKRLEMEEKERREARERELKAKERERKAREREQPAPPQYKPDVPDNTTYTVSSSYV